MYIAYVSVSIIFERAPKVDHVSLQCAVFEFNNVFISVTTHADLNEERSVQVGSLLNLNDITV